MQARRQAFVTAALLGLLAGCGGDGGGDSAAGPSPSPSPSPPATVKGRFIDAPVGNLGFSCGSGANATSGVTDALGAFDYVPGPPAPQCTFAVGGVTLGSATAGAVLTPYSLVPGATPGVPNTAVTNIARFLQSIDDDGNPANGIAIQAETNTALAGKTLDFASPNFDTLAAAVLPAPKTLVSATSAVNALNLSLFGLYAGGYACTYSARINSGVDTVLGTVAVTITFDTLSGTGTPTYPPNGGPYPSFDLSGSLTPGGISNSQTSTGATFDGNFTLDAAGQASGSGNWTDPSLGSGTWECRHT